MKLPFNCCLFVGGLLTLMLDSTSLAQIITYSSTTTIVPAAPCDHVIQLISRHGVNNQFDRSTGARLLNQTSTVRTSESSGSLADLQVLQVNALPNSEVSSGPRFAVTVANHGRAEARDFHISVVAALGQVHSHCPITTIKVDLVRPGEGIELAVTLPSEALSMRRVNGTVLGYDKVIVAVDCFSKIAENDEANNLRLFEFNQVHNLASNVPITEPLRNRIPALSVLENHTLTPGYASAESRVSVDALDLEQPTPDSLRSAIQSISPTVDSSMLLSNQGF